MSQLGAVGVGLSVAFALFMVVLAVELYYVWTSRHKKREEVMQNCGTQVKQVQWSSTWRHMVAVSWSVPGAEEVKRWAKLCHHHHHHHQSATHAGTGKVEEELEAAQGKTSEDGKKQEDEEEEEEEEDVFRVGGLLGPPRLLFTIKEETKEELELEEKWSAGAGKGSLRASRASSDFLIEASACTSPFVTPPSSPPFATPCGSPAPSLPVLSCKPVQDVESSSSSSSSSSPPLGHRPLSSLFEETSSFSSSSSSATPAVLSPSAPLPFSTSPLKRHHHPLSLLLDPPPSPTSALYHYHNRVHPLMSLPPLYSHMQFYGNPLAKPLERPLPSSSFHLPAPSEPTTPCPFRASLNAKSMGFLISATSATTFHLTEV